MTKVLEVDERGSLNVPSDVLGNVPSRTRFVVENQGSQVVLRREDPGPVGSEFWKRTPEERAEAFVQWAKSHRDGPGLPDDALRRENMYE